MRRRLTTALAVLALVILSGAAYAAEDWIWVRVLTPVYAGVDEARLTGNNAAKAVAMCEHVQGDADSTWTSVVYQDVDDGDIKHQVFRPDEEPPAVEPYPSVDGSKAAVAITPLSDTTRDRTHVVWHDDGGGQLLYVDTLRVWSSRHSNWTLHQEEFGDDVGDVAVHAFSDQRGASIYDRVYAAYYDNPALGDDGVYIMRSTDRGESWDPGDPVKVVSVAGADNIGVVSTWQGTPHDTAWVYVVFHVEDGGDHSVYVYKSADDGYTWAQCWAWSDAREPSFDCDDDEVAVTFIKTTGPFEGCVFGSFLKNSTTWVTGLLTSFRCPGTYGAPSLDLMLEDNHIYCLVSSEVDLGVSAEQGHRVAATWFRYQNDDDVLECRPQGGWWLNPFRRPGEDGQIGSNANPATAIAEEDVALEQAVVAWADTSPTLAGNSKADIWASFAEWHEIEDNHDLNPPCVYRGSGHQLALDSEGTPFHATRAGGNIIYGPVIDDSLLAPHLAGGGELPSTAIDGDDMPWVAYTHADSLWCLMAADTTVLVYGGTSAYPPDQPSIATYPDEASGEYAAALTFAVYDSAGETSSIMFAKVHSGSVILDTIESYSTLGDSYPSINIYLGDTLAIAWQHGDSILSAELFDYGPGSVVQPSTAWQDTGLVSADGRCPVSDLDGSDLVVAYRVETSAGVTTRTIVESSHSVGSGAGTWSGPSDVSSECTNDKRNPSLDRTGGVCVWEEYSGSYWRIMASIRGDTTTLVAGDTDRVHPHVCCESTYVSPSISRLTAHLLWTDWVGFEVDSAVYDSGVTRYEVFEFDVSNAEELATASNNGGKLLLEPGGDSLFSVFRDTAGAVVYAQSEDGSSWERETVVSDREYPCLFQDSTGRRWVLCVLPIDPEAEEHFSRVEAYWLSGASWSGPLTILEVSEVDGELATVSGAGGTSSSTSCGFAAIHWCRDGTDRLVVAKFDTTTVLTDTQDVNSDENEEPCIATEPAAGGDNLHLAWCEDNVTQYTTTTAPVHPDSWGVGNIDWEMKLQLSTGIASDPVVAADDERVIVAWVQDVPPGSETDIMCCWRSTDTTYDGFGSIQNISNQGALASNYPVITTCSDTVVVAWTEEKDGEAGYDICASVNYATAVKLVEDASSPSFPHVQYQEPYIHAVWTETPAEDQYAVGYRKVHPDSCTGGSQGAGQLAGLRPLLYACRPNPFTGKTAIRYQFPKAGHVRLQVHDVAGRTVRTLRDGYQAAGVYTVVWDGRANDGRQVANGVYFYRLATSTFEDVKKAVVMK